MCKEKFLFCKSYTDICNYKFFFLIKPTLHYLKEKVYTPELELDIDIAKANFATESASALKFLEMK